MEDNKRAMSILLIEDNEFEVEDFKNYLLTQNDAKLVISTNSSYKGIEYTKMYMPEGIILDLELHKGEGSGISFLKNLQQIKLDFKPLIVVTTNVSSSIIYNSIRELGADFIFYKKQSDYSPEMVINSMVTLRKTLHSNKEGNAKKALEKSIEIKEIIKTRIGTELDLVGISGHLKGRKYFFDAIFYLIDNNEKDKMSVFSYLSSIYKVGTSSISRAMQTAINYAWRTSAVDDLMKYYTARINYETGVPTPTEFIYYYADKIKKQI